MSRPGNKRRLQREQALKKWAVSTKSAELRLWSLGETMVVGCKNCWFSPSKPPPPPPPRLCCDCEAVAPPPPQEALVGCLWGLFWWVVESEIISSGGGAPSELVFRSRVISVMLVVLFIGGRGLFPSNIFSSPLLSAIKIFLTHCLALVFLFSVKSVWA